MLNHITIMGRLTRDPELRTTQSGVNMASFTVAVDRVFAQGGQRETDFIDCVGWRQTGEFVSKYFQKGSMIVVDGRLQSRHWEDRDGNKRTNWEINADRCYFGEAKRDTGSYAPQGNSYGGPPRTAEAYRPAGNASNVEPPADDGFREMAGYGEGNPFAGGGSQGNMWSVINDDGGLPF